VIVPAGTGLLRLSEEHPRRDAGEPHTLARDVFSTTYGSHYGGNWGEQGPELLDRRLAMYETEQRMVFGASTYRHFARVLGSSTEEPDAGDSWVTRMRKTPATVVSTTLEGPLNWPDATVVSGDAVDIIARLKKESVITGQTGTDPIFQDAADFDLELIESRTLDGNTQELIYRRTPHT
jgi:hypothetical protein